MKAARAASTVNEADDKREKAEIFIETRLKPDLKRVLDARDKIYERLNNLYARFKLAPLCFFEGFFLMRYLIALTFDGRSLCSKAKSWKVLKCKLILVAIFMCKLRCK